MTRNPAPKSKAIAKNRIKNSNWKKDNNSKRKNKKYKILVTKYLGMFTLFSASFLFLFTYVTYKKLTSPFVSALSTTSYDIRQEDIFVVVVYSVDDLNINSPEIKSARITFYDAKDKDMVTFDIDPNTELNVAGKFSNEPLSKILALSYAANNDDFDESVKMLNKTLSAYFGYPINKYMVIDDSIEPEFGSLVAGSKKALILDLSFLSSFQDSLKTNVKLSEIYYIYGFASSLSSDAKQEIFLNSESPEATDHINTTIQNVTFDSQVATEKLSIAVLNATTLPGIATSTSRIINNLGGRVISTGNSIENLDKSILIVEDKDSATVSAIVRYFDDIEVVEKKDVNEKFDSEFIRANIILIIGLDLGKGL